MGITITFEQRPLFLESQGCHCTQVVFAKLFVLSLCANYNPQIISQPYQEIFKVSQYQNHLNYVAGNLQLGTNKKN